MMFGLILVVFGYALFYWGLHHFPQYKNERYSLWALLGFGTVFKTLPAPPPGPPVQWKTS